MKPFDAAWSVLKALPEQQQFTDLGAFGEQFGQPRAQHRVGTVHPAIRGMLQRLQYPNLGPRRMGPSLRTVGTNRGNPGGMKNRGMIEAFPGRSARPNMSYELYSGDYGQSPQVVGEGNFDVVPGYFTGVTPGGTKGQMTVAGRIPSADKPPRGSAQQALDDLEGGRLYEHMYAPQLGKVTPSINVTPVGTGNTIREG